MFTQSSTKRRAWRVVLPSLTLIGVLTLGWVGVAFGVRNLDKITSSGSHTWDINTTPTTDVPPSEYTQFQQILTGVDGGSITVSIGSNITTSIGVQGITLRGLDTPTNLGNVTLNVNQAIRMLEGYPGHGGVALSAGTGGNGTTTHAGGNVTLNVSGGMTWVLEGNLFAGGGTGGTAKGGDVTVNVIGGGTTLQVFGYPAGNTLVAGGGATAAAGGGAGGNLAITVGSGSTLEMAGRILSGGGGSGSGGGAGGNLTVTVNGTLREVANSLEFSSHQDGDDNGGKSGDALINVNNGGKIESKNLMLTAHDGALTLNIASGGGVVVEGDMSVHTAFGVRGTPIVNVHGGSSATPALLVHHDLNLWGGTMNVGTVGGATTGYAKTQSLTMHGGTVTINRDSTLEVTGGNPVSYNGAGAIQNMWYTAANVAATKLIIDSSTLKVGQALNGVSISGAFTLEMNNNAVLENIGTANLVFQSNDFGPPGTVFANSILTVSGTNTVNTGAGTSFILRNINATVGESGASALTINGGLMIDGTNERGSMFTLGNGTTASTVTITGTTAVGDSQNQPNKLIVNRSSTFNTGGRTDVTGGTLDILGTYNSTSTQGGDKVLVNNGGSVIIDGANGGKLILNSSSTGSLANFRVALNGDSTLNMKNAALLTGSVSMSNANAKLLVDNSANKIEGLLSIYTYTTGTSIANVGTAAVGKLIVGALDVGGNAILNVGNAASKYASVLEVLATPGLSTSDPIKIGGMGNAPSRINVFEGASLIAKGKTTVDADGTLNIHGTYAATGQNVTITGQSTVGYKGNVMVDGNSALLETGSLTITANAGTLTISNGGSVHVTGATSIRKVGGLVLNGGSLTVGKNDVANTAAIVNNGIYMGAYGTVTLTGWASGSVIDNTGQITIGGGGGTENLSAYRWAGTTFAAIQNSIYDPTGASSNNIILQNVAIHGFDPNITGQRNVAANVQLTLLQDGSHNYGRIYPNVNITGPSLTTYSGDTGAVINAGGILHLDGAAKAETGTSTDSVLGAYTAQAGSVTAVTNGATLTVDSLHATGSNIDVGTNGTGSAITVTNALTLDNSKITVGNGAHTGTFTALADDTTIGAGSTLHVGAGSVYDASGRAITVNGGTLQSSAMILGSGAAGSNGIYANALTISGGTSNVASLNVQVGSFALVSGGSLNMTSLDVKAGGFALVSGGSLTVSGAIQSKAAGDGSSAGISVTGTGVLNAAYGEVWDGSGRMSGLDQISLGTGSMLVLTGGTGEKTLAEIRTINTAILEAASTGTVRYDGITIKTDSTTTLSDVAGAHVEVSTAIIDGTLGGGLSSGTATVGGVTGATTVSGGASLGLTGQGAGNVLATNTVTVTGNAATPTTLTFGSTAAPNAVASTGAGAGVTFAGATAADTNTMNVVGGINTVKGAIDGGTAPSADTINVTGSTLHADGGIILGTGDVINVGSAAANDGSNLTSTNTTLGAGATVNVLNATASLGTVTANGGTLFVDPAFVDIDAINTWGFTVAGGFGGVVNLGTISTAQIAEAVRISGASATASIFATSQPSSLIATGRLVLDSGLPNAAAVNAGPYAGQTLYFGDNSLLVLDGGAFTTPATAALDISATAGTVTVVQAPAASAARLHIVGAKTGDTVHVISGATALTAANTWANGVVTFNNALFIGTVDIVGGAAFNVKIASKASANVFPALQGGTAALVDSVMAQYGDAPNHANAGVRFTSRVFNNDYGLGGATPALAREAAKTYEGATQVGAVGATQASTLGAVNVASSAATSRTSMANPSMNAARSVALNMDGTGNVSLDSGLSAGSGLKNGLGVWLMPLYQHNNVHGMKAGNFESGYNSDLFGISLGADYTIDNMFRFGLALNLGGGNAISNGDFNTTRSNFNFWGVNLYGGWSQNNFGITGDVGYTGNFSKVEQDVPAGLAMPKLKSDVTSNAWTVGLRGEYKFETDAIDITPHVGVRYTGITTDAYDVKSGGTVFKVDQAHQSIWTFPVGVTFSKDIETNSGWIFKPQLDLGVIAAAGDLDAKSRARIPTVASTAEMEMKVVDNWTFDGGLGFEMKKDNVALGLNYNLQLSEHRTGHGVFATFRYEF